MTDTLYIHLLGGIEIRLGSERPLRFASRRAELLLAYLSVTRHSHERERLAALLWDDRTPKQTMANLRSLLAQLPVEVKPFLNLSRQEVGLAEAATIWVDTALFEAECQAAQVDWPQATAVQSLTAAVALYRGDFLAGVYVRNSRGLEEWSLTNQERLRQIALDGHYQLALHALYRRQYPTGIHHASSLLRLDPLRESGYRLLMRLLARNGQQNAALRQYERCYQILAEELGVEPAAETNALHEKIRQARTRPPHKVQAITTPFIGRQAELAHIGRLIDEADCRLVTIVGSGGVGKTRLAVEVAHERRGDYLHGTFLVPLAEVETAATLTAALIDTLEITLQGKSPAQTQLLNYLRSRELLLILDNFEQLIEPGRALIQAIMETAPDVQLLLTSRQRLHLPAEQLVNLRGLAFPPAGRNGQSTLGPEYEAVRLFAHCARRIRRRFSLEDAETEAAVAHICQLVEGLPLALELAAAGLQYAPASQIAANIQQNLDALTVRMRDMPPRHRSIRATFDYSWSLLTAAEQWLFPQLAVFRGGFTAAAVQSVCHDPARPAPNLSALLAGLVGKSLLRCDENGRYSLHELLRHYAAGKRGETTATADDHLARQHMIYYLQHLAAAHDDLRGAKVVTAINRLNIEIQNWRQAWHYAVEQQLENWLEQALESLYIFYFTRCWYEEGDNMLAQAVDILAPLRPTRERQILLGRLWARQGKLCEATTYAGEAERLYRQSIELFTKMELAEEMGLPLHGLGYLAFMQGNSSEARRYLEQSRAAFAQADNGHGQAAALNTLALVARREGKFDEAQTVCQAGLDLRQRLGDQTGVASSLNILGLIQCELGEVESARASLEKSVAICQDLGYQIGTSNALANLCNAAYQLGDFEAATRYAEEGLALYRELGDSWGVAISLNNLGFLAQEQGDFETAERLYRESVAIYRQIGVKSGLATSLGNLGDVCVQVGQYRDARLILQEALQLSIGSEDSPNMLLALAGTAGLLLAGKRVDEALELLLLVQTHPATRPWVKEKAAAKLAQGWPGVEMTGRQPTTNLAEVVEWVLASCFTG